MPGEDVTVDLVVDAAVEEDILDSVRIRIGYDARLLGLRSVGVGPETPVPYGRSDGIIEETLEVNRERLLDGSIARMRFLTGFCAEDSTELPFTLESGLPYVEFDEHPGLFVRDPICGLQQRLFEWADYEFRLDQNVPNPTSSATEIAFETAFDGPTRLVVHDIQGRLRVVLLDGLLKAGPHAVTIPAGTLPPGVYLYEMTSGDYRAFRRMVVY